VTEPTESGGENLWTRLRRRKVVQWAIAYAAAAWTLLQVLEYFGETYTWPLAVRQIAGLALPLGLLFVLVLAWYHGDRGEQRVSRPELAILSTIVALVGGTLWWYASRIDQSAWVADTGAMNTKQALPADAASIAVLPFVNMSSDKEQEYFADGMSEEVLNLLAQLPQLHVIARTSSFSFKGKEADIATIARTLNVAHVLEGSVRKSGGTVRITVQLIRASDSSHLWSQTYDRKLTDVFKVQDEIARAVVAALQVKLLPAERERLAATPTVNAEAYDAYLKGLYHWYRLTRADLDTAEHFFELALAKDPGYARAYAGIGLLWMGRQQMGFVSPAEAAPKANAAALRAVELDDTLADAHYALAVVSTWANWDWPAAEREFRRAIQLNPGFADAHAYYAHLLNILHRPDEAMVEARRSLELDPFNGLFKSLYAVDLLFVHRFDEAIAQSNAALATNPTDGVALAALFSARHHKREYKQALEVANRCASAAGYSEVTTLLAQGTAGADYRATMRKAADTLAARSRNTFVLPWDVASWYAYAGDKDRCLEWLERAYEGRDPNLPYLWFPDFDFLRSDPRFRDLLKRMKLPDGMG
jgi:TolB-like protein/tetratricopeptide (TPR) repeat protein